MAQGVRLSDIVELADRLFPFELAEKWDNCGIQIGDPNSIVHGIGFALDPTPSTIYAAHCNDCNLLITHHPAILKSVLRIIPDSFVGRTIFESFKWGVSLVALHTNFDAAPGGLNDSLAGMLKLTDIRVPSPANCARTGKLAEPTSLCTLAKDLKAQFNSETLRFIGDADKKIESVFLACGSGSGYLPEALQFGSDVMITGDIKYHTARESMELGLSLIDVGHFPLEIMSVKLLKEAFERELDSAGLKIPCIECNNENDPFQGL